MNKRELYSGLLLIVSLIIFSVGIPYIQEKIDYWKHQREIYSKNLLNSEFQRVVGILTVSVYETIDIIKQAPIAKDSESIKLINKIQELYLEKARKASANMQFLQTEPVNNDEKPDMRRYNEIKRKLYEKSPLFKTEADLYLDNFNQDYQRGLKFWGDCKAIAYILAIFLHVWGVWVGLRDKKDPNANLIKEIKALTSRINTLIKKK